MKPDNQLGRRNLTPYERKYLIGQEYNLEKKQKGGTGANQFTVQKGQNDPSAQTAEIIAARHGVSPKTVKRAGKYADRLDKLPPGERAAILAGFAGHGRVVDAGDHPSPGGWGGGGTVVKGGG